MKKILTAISLFVCSLCMGLFIVGIAHASGKAFAAASATNPITTIRFATEATYPPFEYVDDSGHITGFDIDIAKALCAAIKAQCTFTSQSFASLIPSLQLRKYDAIIGGLGITPERLQQVDFTQSYYQPSASFIAATSKHYSLKEIKGKIIGVQAGSTFETYLQDKYKNVVTVKTYASIQDAFLDLIAGRVDIVIADTPIALQWLNQGDNKKSYSIVDKPVTDDQYFGTGYGIAVRKNNTQLLNALNQALDTIKSNGTYANIEKKYSLDQAH